MVLTPRNSDFFPENRESPKNNFWVPAMLIPYYRICLSIYLKNIIHEKINFNELPNNPKVTICSLKISKIYLCNKVDINAG